MAKYKTGDKFEIKIEEVVYEDDGDAMAKEKGTTKRR